MRRCVLRRARVGEWLLICRVPCGRERVLPCVTAVRGKGGGGGGGGGGGVSTFPLQHDFMLRRGEGSGWTASAPIAFNALECLEAAAQPERSRMACGSS